MAKTIVAGNWKMNLTLSEAQKMVADLVSLGPCPEDVTGILIPNFVALKTVADEIKGTSYKLGAQNMSSEDQGAFTGEISWDMLTDVGASYCIIGHSERRTIYLENNSQIEKKLKKALASGITPILCVGESQEKREAGEAKKRVEGQIHRATLGLKEEDVKKIIIAYEPLWAIGTGAAASPEDAEDMCKTIREWIRKGFGDEVADQLSILYGGSVKPENIQSFLEKEDINGALVGGASLKAKDFYALCQEVSHEN